MRPSQELFQNVEAKQPAIRTALLETYFADQPAGFAETAAGEAALFEQGLRRTRFFVNSMVPWIGRFCDLGSAKVVEVGGGTGSSTVAIASETREVAMYDISQPSIDAADRRAAILGVDNVSHRCAEPDVLLPEMLAEHEGTADVFLLFATLEHQKIEERFESLRAGWAALREGGILVVGDTPNRLVYCQTHTSRMPFFDMLPHELQVRFAEQSPNRAFADAVQRTQASSPEDVRELIDRWGRGVSYHEFEVVFGDLRPLTVAHGFEPELFRMEPPSLDERLLVRYFHEMQLPVPLAFARSTLYLILQKRTGDDAPAPQWDPDFDPARILD